ncbi:MAG: MiaB/RimO family radical SAM methylthiotransferase [bacterium]|nr:MiaB/RimO family radical SAM methylthiotransferase [bacterium]
MSSASADSVRVHLRTYGCQMNVLDSQIITGLLETAGFSVVEDEAEADAFLFNTCSVRDLSERKVLGKLGQLRHARARRPELVFGVCGCMAELSGERLLHKNPHVDFVCGTNCRSHIPSLLVGALQRRLDIAHVTRHNACHLERLRGALASLLARIPPIETNCLIGTAIPEGLDERVARRPHPWHAYVEIMRGCSNFCSYCVVPYARGPEVSRPMDEILRELEQLAAAGCVEVTLLGQNVNSYGRDLEGRSRFALLLRRVSEIPGIRWVRFLTSNPYDISEELVETVASSPKICHQIHFPLQSGSDRILRAMNRKYTCAEYLEKVARIRSAVPDMAFSSDFIVGFPGETEEDFAATYAAMEQVKFANAFIFKYSARRGTAAAALPDDVPRHVKEARHQALLALQSKHTLLAHEAHVGSHVEVLVEGPSKRNPEMLQGRTSRFFNVIFPGQSWWAGTFRTVRVTHATPLALYAEPTA